MKEAFDKYVNNYDLNNKDIKKKYLHSYRVMSLSKKYAQLLGWNKHDIELASLIGLLHDIGRFEQLKIYNTFDDSKSIDHAHYGVIELFEKGYIKNFWKNEKDYEIIKFAIENHNKYEIEKTNNEKYLKHAKLIRDTDKIDILYLLGSLQNATIFADNKGITEIIKKNFSNNKSIELKDRVTNNDKILANLAYAYNIYNNICLEELKRNLITYINFVDKNHILDKYFQEILIYIKKRTKED